MQTMSVAQVALLVASILAAGCSKAVPPSSPRDASAPPPAAATARLDASPPEAAAASFDAGVAAAASAIALPDGPPTFEGKAGQELQQLWIVSKKKKAVEFALHRGGSCDLQLSGRATGEGEGELESDDDDMAAYFALKYDYKAPNGCYVTIVFNLEDTSKAKVRTNDCKLACELLEEPMKRLAR